MCNGESRISVRRATDRRKGTTSPRAPNPGCSRLDRAPLHRRRDRRLARRERGPFVQPRQEVSSLDEIRESARPEHRRSRSDPRRRYVQTPSLRGVHGRTYSEATTCEWLYCHSDSRTSSWRFSDPLRSGASSSSSRSRSTLTARGVSRNLHPNVNTRSSSPFGLWALRVAPGPLRLLIGCHAPNLWFGAPREDEVSGKRGA
jgi:hypothetical protein